MELDTLAALEILAMFPAGKSVDVPEYLADHGNPEAAQDWIEMNKEHGDNFKVASLTAAMDELSILATWEEGHVTKDNPRDHAGEGSLTPGLDPKTYLEDQKEAEKKKKEKKAEDTLSLLEKAAEDHQAQQPGDITKDTNLASMEGMLARFEKEKPADPCQNMTEADCDKWKKMNEEHGDKFKSSSEKENEDSQKSLSASWGEAIPKEASGRAPTGLYGYTRAIQSSCEGSVSKLTKVARALAKKAYLKDEKVPTFLATHAKRGSSLPAKILVAAMKGLGPKIASQIEAAEAMVDEFPKTASSDNRYGLYGYFSKTANLGLTSCSNLREAAGHIASDLHSRRAEQHAMITGFLQNHAKQGRCLYSKLLHSSYPDPEMRLASEKTTGIEELIEFAETWQGTGGGGPKTASEWLAWEE